MLFFWSFEILVFLVLLNFLLAIIVDAFGDIKGGAGARAGWSRACKAWLQKGTCGTRKRALLSKNNGSKQHFALPERTTETTGIHTELLQILRHLWSSALARFSPDAISDRELGRLLRWWREGAGAGVVGAVAAAAAALRELH